MRKTYFMGGSTTPKKIGVHRGGSMDITSTSPFLAPPSFRKQ